jgi:PKD repeat protein
LTFLSWENPSGFPDLSLNDIGGGFLVGGGYLTDPSGYSIPDDSVFFSITFLYNGGTGSISWIDNGPTCEFTGPFPDFIVLNDIPTSKYYINGNVLPSLVANFSSSTLQPGISDTVYFTDLSTGGPDGWIWNFLPDSVLFVNGTTQNSQNPVVTFISNGAYSVSFKVSNSSCSSILNRDNYLHVGTPGLWTGNESTDWNNPGNWHNGLVPGATIAVLIPSWSLNWPEYLENLTIGVQCFNLTIESNGQMTVAGDLIIP